MDYELPQFSRTKVDKSARTLIDPNSDEEIIKSAEEVVSNWRSAHAFPLNTITMDLKAKSSRVNKNALIVQRLKRTRSILSKLSRETSMRLTQMQDIGGCRAVLKSVKEVRTLREYYLHSRAEHKFIDDYDYIDSPKESGYRGIHLIYSYKSRSKPEYNGLLCEIQIRTELQHAWATAVETVGAVLGQSLKSSEGETTWLEFFQLAAEAFAFLESTAPSSSITLSRPRLSRLIKSYMEKLDVDQTLNSYRHALKATEDSKVKHAGYFLLVLRPDTPALEIIAYKKGDLSNAYDDYMNFEKELPSFSRDRQLSLFPELVDYSGAQAVLVGAQSFRSLRQSYPNYFLDTGKFLTTLNGFIGRW